MDTWRRHTPEPEVLEAEQAVLEFGGTPLLSRSGYRHDLLFAWVYAACWAAALVAVAALVQSTGLTIVLMASLVLLNPGGAELTQSYERYRRRWHLANPHWARGSGPVEG